jgi:hypothetical protein
MSIAQIVDESEGPLLWPGARYIIGFRNALDLFEILGHIVVGFDFQRATEQRNGLDVAAHAHPNLGMTNRALTSKALMLSAVRSRMRGPVRSAGNSAFPAASMLPVGGSSLIIFPCHLGHLPLNLPPWPGELPA